MRSLGTWGVGAWELLRNVGTWAVGAWGLAASGVLAVTWAAFVPLTGRAVPLSAPLRPSPSLSVPPYPADSVAEVVVARDLFRAARRPAAVAYDPAIAAAPPPAFDAPKPALVLVGLVHGADPSAVIEGFPGIEGARVVRSGDRVGDLRVVGITADRVRIVGMDTVWVLKVREPWK